MDRQQEPANSQPLPGDTEYDDKLHNEYDHIGAADNNDVGNHDHDYIIADHDKAPDDYHVYHGATKIVHYHDKHYHVHHIAYDYGPAVFYHNGDSGRRSSDWRRSVRPSGRNPADGLDSVGGNPPTSGDGSAPGTDRYKRLAGFA